MNREALSNTNRKPRTHTLKEDCPTSAFKKSAVCTGKGTRGAGQENVRAPTNRLRTRAKSDKVQQTLLNRPNVTTRKPTTDNDVNPTRTQERTPSCVCLYLYICMSVICKLYFIMSVRLCAPVCSVCLCACTYIGISLCVCLYVMCNITSICLDVCMCVCICVCAYV